MKQYLRRDADRMETRRPMTTRTSRTALIAMTTVLVAVVAGCSGGPMEAEQTQQPQDAKRAVQQIVDDSTKALGGTWTVEEGPRLGTCTNERGEGDGVNYTILSSRGERGDTERDVETLEALWKRHGLTTERFGSAGAKYTGVNGAGATLASVSFSSSDLGGGDTISATSACADGDYVEMREQERGQG